MMDHIRLASLKLVLLFSVLALAVNISHEKQNHNCPIGCMCGTTSKLHYLIKDPDAMDTLTINCTGT